jgi:hypothetical protein
VDAGTITAIVGAFTALGAGAWKLIDRADKKRERREIKVEELLKSRVATLEAAATASRRYAARMEAAARRWREQLVAHNITPDPAEWPEEETNE